MITPHYLQDEKELIRNLASAIGGDERVLVAEEYLNPGQAMSQATLTTVQAAAPSVTRGPDIANSPSVPPELSKLPSGFSIFPVVPSSGGSQVVPGTSQETVPGSQVCVSNNGNTYYQAAPSYVAASVPHRAELTTIPMAAWPGWHMTAQPVNMRSPAKVEPGDSKYWEPSTAYFRAPLP